MLRNTLEELGYTQPPTSIKTENFTTAGIENFIIKLHQSRYTNIFFGFEIGFYKVDSSYGNQEWKTRGISIPSTTLLHATYLYNTNIFNHP